MLQECSDRDRDRDSRRTVAVTATGRRVAKIEEQ